MKITTLTEIVMPQYKQNAKIYDTQNAGNKGEW